MSLTKEITNFQIRIRNFLKYVYAIDELSKELGSCQTHEVRERIAELQDLQRFAL